MKNNLFAGRVNLRRILLWVVIGLLSTTVMVSPSVARQTTPTDTPAGPTQLTIWWPDTLGQVTNEATELLSNQIGAFQRSQPDVRVSLRLKKRQGVGSLIETLGAAFTVAPGALPDAALLRYPELVLAARSRWIQPLTGVASADILADVYPAAIRLGQVDNQWYGIPYALEFTHIAYRPIVLSGNFARFDGVLADRQGFVFPASPQGELSDMFLIQYLSAGGDLAELNRGNISLDALRIVLNFYQQATAAGLIDASVLNYLSTDDYFPRLVNGEISAAVVRSGQYLELLEQNTSFEAAPLPQADGDPMTILDGWIWVIVTPEEQRQSQILQFIEWMMGQEHQSAYTRLVPVVPSQQSAMQSDRDRYVTFMEELLSQAQLPITGDVLPVIQITLADVLQGRRTPEQAALDALSQTGN